MLQWVEGKPQFSEPKTPKSRRSIALSHRVVKSLKKHRTAQLKQRLARRFHDLRHTTESFLLHQKVHPRLVMDLLGHSEIRVTLDLYSPVSLAMQRETADQMDALMGKKAARK